MADRRSVYGDPRIVALSERFVCAADEVWRLQRGSDNDCVFFQRMVNGGERITDKGTRQGAWVCAPSGRLLAHANTRDVDAMVAMLERGLAEWERLSDEERRLPADVDLTPEHRWESNRPEDGLVLERIGRELGPDGLAGERSPFWNRDHVWFARTELREQLGDTLEVGDAIELPLVAQRLARFHLVDNVRGQTLPFAAMEVRRAELVAHVVARDAERVSLRLEGSTAAESSDEWLGGDNTWKPSQAIPHGIECTLLGEAVWSTKAERFEAFDLVAVGRRWGHTVMNGRWRDPSPGLVAFTFAPGGTGVAPTFVAVYDADWIVPPKTPTWRDDPAEVGLAD